MFTRFAVALSVAVLFAVDARADEFWVTYEGEDYPENQNWLRTVDDGGAVRTLENGNLVLDTHRNPPGLDYYRRFGPGNFDPGPGEAFVLEFRVRVTGVSHPIIPDTSIGFAGDAGAAAAIAFRNDAIVSVYNWNIEIPITPGVFHTYHLMTSDMRSYSLLIDGVEVLVGDMFPSTSMSRVAWGDGTAVTTSRSEWDYVRYGVVPEPITAALVIPVSLCMFARRWPAR